MFLDVDLKHEASQHKRSSPRLWLFTLMFWFFLILVAIQPSQAVLSDRSVNRLNYGAYFRHVNSYLPKSSYYLYSFELRIPDRYPGFTFDILPERNTTSKTDLYKQRWLRCLDMSRKGTNRAPSVGALCAKFAKNIEFLLQLGRSSHDTLDNLWQSIDTLLPPDYPFTDSKQKRTIVGSILKFLGDVPTREEFDTLASHIKTLKEANTDFLKNIKIESTSMSDFVRATTHRLDGLVEAMRESAVDQVRALDDATQTVETLLLYSNNVTLHTIQFSVQIENLISYYSNFLTAVQTLHSGSIPSLFVTKSMITRMLDTISTRLRHIQSTSRIVDTNPTLYFKQGGFILSRHSNSLFITLRVGLTTFQNPFRIYELIKYPLTLPSGKQHRVMLTNVPDYVAIDDSQSYFYRL